MPDSLAERVQKALLVRHLFLVTAESCTGGMIAAALTDVSGASKVFDRGFVTYSNEAKIELLNVPAALLVSHGAVSAETARAMAEGALLPAEKSRISVAVTGIAGPDGGSAKKPVGLVFIAIGKSGMETLVYRHEFSGDRDAVRRQTVDAAFGHILEMVAA